MRSIDRVAAAAVLICAAFLADGAGQPAAAQAFDTGFAGLASDSSQPIEIEADELEVRDKEGVAVFTGNVTVKQQGAALQTQRLTVHYVGEPEGGGEGAATPGSGQEIDRLEADGKVLVTSEGQAASGDSGYVDMQGKELVLAGNVTLTQGPNVVTGDRLVVDLNNGRARIESTSRVRMLLTPNSGGGSE